MKVLRLVFVACVAAVLAAGASADDKKDTKDKDKDKDKVTNVKDKIVGVWELQAKGIPTAPTMEFTKDGKILMTVKMADREIKVEGTYKVDGDKLMTALKPPMGGANEFKQTLTVTKLTDNELDVKDDKGMVTHFTKKK
jgi:uncharacterized protein (TIGR03066 family)